MGSVPTDIESVITLEALKCRQNLIQHVDFSVEITKGDKVLFSFSSLHEHNVLHQIKYLFDQAGDYVIKAKVTNMDTPKEDEFTPVSQNFTIKAMPIQATEKVKIVISNNKKQPLAGVEL